MHFLASLLVINQEGRISVTNSSPITLINNGISIRSTYVILTVTNAKLEDTGTYQCTSTDHTNKQDSATSKVTVQGSLSNR